jgi:orotate phosphoribosyltransferase
MKLARLKQTVDSRCWLSGEFALRSGKISNRYFDKYLLESDPLLLNQISEALNERIPKTTDILAGIELGGVPLATAISLKRNIPVVFVRKAAKTYGTCQQIEGCPVQGKRITLVEDVVSTGGAVINSMEALRKQGATIDAIVCVMKRDSTLKQLNGVPLFSVF